MKKNLLSILLLVLLLLPFALSAAPQDDSVVKQGDTGSTVYAIQRRLSDLGYLNYRPTGKFSDMTLNAVRKFQQVNGIASDGQVGASTIDAIFSANAKRNTQNPAFKSTAGLGNTAGITRKGALSAWEMINEAFPTGSEAAVTDYYSGKTFNVKRVGGQNCAQVTPVTEEDYQAYSDVFRAETWEHRSMLVSIGGVEYAASMFGMPSHASNTSGPMQGYTILYFNNSKTDLYALPDEEHIIAIERIS